MTKLRGWRWPLLTIGAWSLAGCVSLQEAGLRTVDRLPKDSPKGYVEFYAENDDTLSMSIPIAHMDGEKVLCDGSVRGGQRLRIARPPGTTAFLVFAGHGVRITDGCEVPDVILDAGLKLGFARPVFVPFDEDATTPVRLSFTEVSRNGSLVRFTWKMIVEATRTEEEQKPSPPPPPPTAHKDLVRSLTMSADSKLLVSAASDGVLKVWDVSSGMLRATKKLRYFNTPVAMSADGQLLAAGGDDIKVWSLPYGELQATFTGFSKSVSGLGMSADKRWVASGGHDSVVRLWSLTDQRLQATLTGHAQAVTYVAFSPDATQMITASMRSREGDAIKLWAVPSGALLATMQETNMAVEDMFVTLDWKHVVARTADYHRSHPTIEFGMAAWSLPDGRRVKNMESVPVSYMPMVLSPDGKSVVSSGGPRSNLQFRLWSLPDGQPQGFVEGAVDGNMYPAVAISHDNRLLAVGGDDFWGTNICRISLWSLPDGQLVTNLPAHRKGATALTFSPDGRWLVSGGSDGRLYLWDVQSQFLRQELGTDAAPQDAPSETAALPGR